MTSFLGSDRNYILDWIDDYIWITELLKLAETFWDHLFSLPTSKQMTYRWPKVFKAVPHQVLAVSKDGRSSASPSNVFQLSTKESFSYKRNFLYFILCPVFHFASYLFTGHYWEVSGSVFLTPSHQVFIYVNEILPEPSLHQVKQSQLSQPLHTCQMLQKSI